MPGLSQAPPPTDAPVVDTAEQVYISSLALLKMLKHGRAGVPMEVMGLMLGELSFDIHLIHGSILLKILFLRNEVYNVPTGCCVILC